MTISKPQVMGSENRERKLDEVKSEASQVKVQELISEQKRKIWPERRKHDRCTISQECGVSFC